jgi:hypothetical protein
VASVGLACTALEAGAFFVLGRDAMPSRAFPWGHTSLPTSRTLNQTIA